MIQFAYERVPDGDFRVGDIENLPYGDNVFDAVFAANAIQYTADRVATLREFGRAQKSAGPFQKALQVAGKEKLRLAIREAIETYCLDDGAIHIQPNVFKYVVAEL